MSPEGTTQCPVRTSATTSTSLLLKKHGFKSRDRLRRRLYRPYGTRNSFPFPGTAVPGYRLFRPYGTGPARLDIVPFCRRTVLGPDELTPIGDVLCKQSEAQVWLIRGYDQSSVWVRARTG